MKTRTRALADTVRDTKTPTDADRRLTFGPGVRQRATTVGPWLQFELVKVYSLKRQTHTRTGSINLNIPANHRVQSSAVITANALVSLRKQ